MSTLEGLADRLAAGEPLDETGAAVLLASHDLVTIGAIGDDVRRRLHGTRTTFLRVFEVHVDAVPARLPDRLAAGEIRLVGRPPSADAAVGAVRRLAALAGGVPVTGFSLCDLHVLGGGTDEGLPSLCAELAACGLYGIAEVAIDRLEDAARRVGLARAAGLRVERLVVHEPAGDGSLSLVQRAGALQRAVGGFRAFAPLPRQLSTVQPSTGYDDVKQIVLARVLVQNIPSIQVDWPLYGPKLAQVALTMGADDVDGVLADDRGSLGPRRSALEEIRRNIRAAALEPLERDGRFEVVG